MSKEKQTQNVCLLLEYDGGCFGGWQRIENGKKPSVQGTLEQLFLQETGKYLTMIGSGRTDAGVHALGQVANVHLPLSYWRERLPKEWQKHWNCLLPAGLRIREAVAVSRSFHSRYDAVGKTYCYVFDIREVPSVFAGRYAYREDRTGKKVAGEKTARKKITGKGSSGWREQSELEVPSAWNWSWDALAVEQASAYLIGEHDFSAFSSRMEPGRGTVRQIERLEWKRLRQYGGDFLIMEVEGNGFLYHMVRILAGTLYEIGMGKRDPKSIQTALKSRKREEAGRTLPGYGLFLKKVYYPDTFLSKTAHTMIETAKGESGRQGDGLWEKTGMNDIKSG